MKYIMKVRMPSGDEGNNLLRDPQFGQKMENILKEVKAEASYWTTICGNRGGYVIVNMEDASEMVAKAEPFFFGFKAEVTFSPVMTMQDLAKAGPAMGAAMKNWG